MSATVNKNFWYTTYNDNLSPRQSLQGSKTVDIAILGGGFTGLWTAYYLKNQNPSLDIAILEQEFVGYGASGRNGGWCSPTISVGPSESIRRYGMERTKQTIQAMFDTVNEIEKVIAEEKIEADWKKGGALEIALGDYGLPGLESSVETYTKLGFGDEVELLNEEQTRERVFVAGAKGGMFLKNSAVINPYKLVRQLARVLEKNGITIYENTKVIDIVEGNESSNPKLITNSGELIARHACVLAGEAYMSQLSKFHRQVIPIYSLITVSEPLTEDQWEQIGWKERETVGSTRLSVDYLQKTADGRILFGGRGQPYRYGSKIKDSFDYHKPTHQLLQQMFKKWFPMLQDVKFTHSWGGPLGVTRDWTPNVLYNKRTKIASVWGYVGQGVSTTNLTGRIVTDLILERETDITTLPIVNHKSRKWEIEPFRWLGARYVQYGLAKVDRIAEEKGIPPSGKTLAERLSRR